MQGKAVGTTEVRDAALCMLDVYVVTAGHQQQESTGFEDAGPLLVAALASAPDAGSDEPAPVPHSVPFWLRSSTGKNAHLGVHGRGMAGFVLGLSDAAQTWPALSNTAAKARARLVTLAQQRPWRTTDVGWEDYDIITGPAGTLGVLTADPACTAEECAPVVDHLVALCAGDDLAGLRVGQYEGDELRGWNRGRINAGMGHGVPGVAAGLQVAAHADVLSDAGYEALSRIAAWLVKQSFVDGRGVRTWPNSGLAPSEHGARHTSGRQAWCYGGPGIAWTLWETARALGDVGLSALALDAARSFLDNYDGDYYLDREYPDNVAICHGAAGLILLYDAFDRYAGLPGAALLRDHLIGYVHERLDRVVELTQENPTLLDGATGVLATLLTCQRDGSRRWLRAFGLR